MMQNMRKWINTWLGASVGVAAAVLFLATVTVGYAAESKVKGKAEEKPTQGQQLCPATPGGRSMSGQDRMPPHQGPGANRLQGHGGLSPSAKSRSKLKRNPSHNRPGPESRWA